MADTVTAEVTARRDGNFRNRPLSSMDNNNIPIQSRPIGESQKISRRDFVKQTSVAGLLCGLAGIVGPAAPLLRQFSPQNPVAAAPPTWEQQLLGTAPRARYWIATTTPGVTCQQCHPSGEAPSPTDYHQSKPLIQCQLCARNCTIGPGERGNCNARMNIAGELRSLVYGRPVSMHVDPIEKKPFYHFLPGSQAFSLATTGCPLHCQFCQNWELSQAKPEDYRTEFIPPEMIVQATVQRQAGVIAFTYNEPTVFTEYLTDIARVAADQRLRCVMISCGFMNEAPLNELCSVLDAIKIDLKGFSNDFYQRVCSAELPPVLRSIKQIARSGIHLEIVNLVVPTLNDSRPMLTDLVEWLAGEIGPDVPVLFTRFHPDYKMLNLPPTPIATLEMAYDIARERGLHYPYVGNVPGHPGNNTFCPACGKAVIERTGFFVIENHLTDGHCQFCREPIAGVWN
ncbi:MAG: AmmeMemoRadiSam system radical SAM enzyme [Candidatus Neomarinimicrobiota bacterium]